MTPPAVEPDEGLVEREWEKACDAFSLNEGNCGPRFCFDAGWDAAIATLTPPIRAQALEEAWRPIETCEMWTVAIVTDGERVAIAQRAEDDYGGAYWAIEPEDGLDWEPTLWTPHPDDASALKGGQGV